jgi:hypothetical protein
MKKGMNSLQEFAAEIERRAKAKKDFVTNTRSVALVPVDKNEVDLTVGDMRFGVNQIGHAQLAETAGIPKQYYDTMLREQPQLLVDNVNTWFKANQEDRLFRTLDDKVRAVRSDKFRVDLEYEDLAEAVLPVLINLDVAVMSYQLTETRMYIKAVDKSVERELTARGGKFGDGAHNIVRCLSPAITISDSEVGFGSASVLAGVYDGFCSNLATFGERSVRKYHVGAKHEFAGDNVYSLLSDETKRKTSVATIAQIADVVKAAFDQAKFDSLCNKISDTQEQPITGDIVKVVSMAGKKLGLNETEGRNVLQQLAAGGDLSRFGMYNAVTAMSQNVDDYDRATELERIGAQIIELPKSDWRVIAEAA